MHHRQHQRGIGARQRLDDVVGGDVAGQRVVGEQQAVAQDLGGEIEDVLRGRVGAAAQQRECPGTAHEVERRARARAEGRTASDLELLRALGARADWDGEHDVRIDGASVSSSEAPYDLVRKMRASIYVLGPLLAAAGLGAILIPFPAAVDDGVAGFRWLVEGGSAP
mgnify:CR=1 FL=1